MSTAVIWSISEPDVESQYGGRLGEFHGMSPQSHVSQCRVLPVGEFTVMIPAPHATLQDVIIPPAMLKIVFRHILFIFNAFWATRGGFVYISSPIYLLYIIYDILPTFVRRVGRVDASHESVSVIFILDRIPNSSCSVAC